MMVVTAAAVSSTKRAGTLPRGPVTNASRTFSSRSVTNKLARLIIEDQERAAKGLGLPREAVSDHLVVIPPGQRLIERFTARLAASDDACGAKPGLEGM